jgi:predicted Zn-dependent peptidase
MHRIVLLLLACLPWSLSAAPAVDIPHETFRLDNGLTVVVATDRKAPVVAVHVWYHVGGKDEPADRHEFAHWFEHLMFKGSEHWDKEYTLPFEAVGATDQNGTTSADRTNYFQTVPSTALDMALWMESDRMGHLLGALDQATLDAERGIVRNEKRQRENQPYGGVWDRILRASYPAGHPYHVPDIAADQLLEGATLEEAKDWFRTWYGAANATLVLAGDIDVATARAKVERYFGDIEAGPPLSRHKAWIAPRTDSRREVMADRVAQTRIYRTWNVPPTTDADIDRLGLIAQVLGGSAASRLDARLVHGEQLADSVSAFTYGQEIAGLFGITADVRDGVDPAVVERALDEELARLIADGPTRAELERARTTLVAGFVRGIEKVGGFSGKAEVLAECQVFHGDAGCFRRQLATLEAATPDELRAVARRWLAHGDYTLVVTPYPRHQAKPSNVDRSAGPPATEAFPALAFPGLERATLRNGIPVVLARRAGVPLVQVQALFDAGFAADAGGKLGTAAFAMAMLDEGAGDYDALAFKAAAEDLGAVLGAGAGLDTSSASLSALKDRLDPSLALFATMLREPRLAASDLERVRQNWLARIAQEKTQPNAIAQRLLPPLLYGQGHAYAIPFTGSGSEASITALTRTDLDAHLARWIRPDNLRFVATGDITLDELVARLERHFGDWRAPVAPRGSKAVAAVAAPTAPRVFLVDRPDAEQSVILGGILVPSSRDPQALITETANTVFGGMFTARLNTNLREQKNWSYGAYSSIGGAREQRPLFIAAPVQRDRTVDALAEILREIDDYTGTRPASADELARVIVNDVRGLPGSYETGASVLGALVGIEVYGRPDDWVRTLKPRIEAQTLDDVHKAARAIFRKDAMTWIIVGDLARIEAPIRALGIGAVQVLDVDGRPVEAAAR